MMIILFRLRIASPEVLIIILLLDPATDLADSATDLAEWPSNPTSDSDVVNQNSHTIPKKVCSHQEGVH